MEELSCHILFLSASHTKNGAHHARRKCGHAHDDIGAYVVSQQHGTIGVGCSKDTRCLYLFQESGDAGQQKQAAYGQDGKHAAFVLLPVLPGSAADFLYVDFGSGGHHQGLLFDG